MRTTSPYWETGMRKSGCLADTRDSGIGTGRTHVKSLVLDSMHAKGNFGVDASTPRTGVNDWP